MKDLENPQFSNSGAKVEIMCGYKSGVNIFVVKVKFINDVSFGLIWIHGSLWCMVQITKTIISGLKFCDAKHQKLILHGLKSWGAKHQI